jgi:hypothetical protein
MSEEKGEPKGNSSEALLVVAAGKPASQRMWSAYKRVLEINFWSSRKMMRTPTNRLLRVCKDTPDFTSPPPLSPRMAKESLGRRRRVHVEELRVLAIATRSFESLPLDEASKDLNAKQKLEAWGPKGNS